MDMIHDETTSATLVFDLIALMNEYSLLPVTTSCAVNVNNIMFTVQYKVILTIKANGFSYFKTQRVSPMKEKT